MVSETSGGSKARLQEGQHNIEVACKALAEKLAEHAVRADHVDSTVTRNKEDAAATRDTWLRV